jgi:hypothetical protein
MDNGVSRPVQSRKLAKARSCEDRREEDRKRMLSSHLAATSVPRARIHSSRLASRLRAFASRLFPRTSIAIVLWD